jgi:hypothetical protein
MDIYTYINLQKLDVNTLYKHLINDTKYMVEEIDFALYDLFEYEPPTKLYELKEKRLKQEEFHKQIIKRDKKCIITNRFSKVCQACHIIPFSICSEEQKYDPDNGLLLSADIHILFDNYLLSINPNTLQVILSDELLNNDDYNQYHLQEIILTTKQKNYLKHHWNIFCKMV